MSVFDRISAPRRHQLLGLALLAGGLLTALALLSAAGDSGQRPWRILPSDAAGVVGRAWARGLAGLFGPTLALGVPLAFLAWGSNRLLLRPVAALTARTLAASVLGLFLLGLLGLGDLDGRRAGWVGQSVAVNAAGMLGEVGAHLVLWAGLLVAVLALLDLGLADFLMGLVGFWRAGLARARALGQKLRGSFAPGAARDAFRPAPAPATGAQPFPEGRLAPAAPPPVLRASELDPAAAPGGKGRGPAASPGNGSELDGRDFRSRLRAERERAQAAMAADLRPPRVARPEELAGHPGMDAQAPVLPPGTARPTPARETEGPGTGARSGPAPGGALGAATPSPSAAGATGQTPPARSSSSTGGAAASTGAPP